MGFSRTCMRVIFFSEITSSIFNDFYVEDTKLRCFKYYANVLQFLEVQK